MYWGEVMLLADSFREEGCYNYGCVPRSQTISKHSSYQNQGDYLGLKPIDLQHIYRSLDYLTQYQEAFQVQVFQTDHDLLFINTRLSTAYNISVVCPFFLNRLTINFLTRFAVKLKNFQI